ncbi:MAG: hypothetical protein NTX03_02290 [Bacteroidetes bacterium]|nr:hypothetical protein [Bacteroidota bacterium]
MKTRDYNHIIIKYAGVTVVLYILYFVIMKMLGWADVPALRFVNYIIYAMAAYLALKDVVKAEGGALDYLGGLGIAFLMGVSSFVVFGLLILIYTHFDSFFVDTLLVDFPTSASLGKFGPCILVIAEGTVASVVVSLTLMQYFKKFSKEE